MRTQTVIHTINGATATQTGAPINIATASSISVFVKRSNHGTGSSSFTVEVSPNYKQIESEGGVNTNAEWVQYRRLVDNVAQTNAQSDTLLASKDLSSNTTDFVTVQLAEDTAEHMRVTVTETTDGTHDAWVVITYDA